MFSKQVTKVNLALAPYIEWDKQIRQCSEGCFVCFDIPGKGLQHIAVTGITWGGSIELPIVCFTTLAGGLIDMRHYSNF